MRKKIYCPCCHQRLMDGTAESVAHTRVSLDVQEDKADYIIKCPRCKQEIGIKQEPGPKKEIA